MTIYIIVYSLLFLSIFYEIATNKLSKKKKILILNIFIFTLFRGLRWNTGTDWNQFLYHFNNLNINNMFSYSRYGGDETIEPLYALINVIVGFLGNYSLFLIATNLFILYTYYYFSVNYTPRPLVTFALLLLCVGFFPVRLELAATVLMWTIPTLVNRKLCLFLLIVFIACLIHKSAVVFIPFYWLLNWSLNFSIQIALYTTACFFIDEFLIRNIILGLSFVIPVSSVQEAAQNYLNASFDYNVTKIASKLMSYIMAVLFLTILHYNEKRNRTNLYKQSVNSYLYLSCISQVIPENISDLGRIGGFFIWGLPIAFSFVVDYYFRTKFRNLALILLVLYGIYKFVRMCNIFPDALFPYYSIFNSLPYDR